MEQTGLARQARRARDHPSAVLLVCQLGAVLLYPFLGDAWLGRAALGVVGMLVVGLALWAVRRTPVLNLFAFALGLPALVFTVLEAGFPHNDAIGLTSALLHAPFYFYVSYGMIRYLFHDEHVSTDELFATGAAFTVVAWGFAYVFSAVEIIWPGSFATPGGSSDPNDWFQLLYLSFTTLTSVGLSDVAPVLAHARSVVMLEQLAGVMYVALVVARLVGLTITRRER
jgi:Ion channel